MAVTMWFVAFAATSLVHSAAGVGMESTANPIRRVVTMLEKMQHKVIAEGEREQKIYDEVACSCQTSRNSLSESIAAGNAKVAELTSGLEKATSEHDQLAADVVQHKADRTSAKNTMAEADNVRAAEAAQFAKDEPNLQGNIAALTGAIKAIAQGRGEAAAFVQTEAGAKLQALISADANADEADKKDVLAFLSGSAPPGEYVPQSQEISGILKQIKDNMEQALAGTQAAEAAAIKEHAELIAAKTKEVAALTENVERKMERKGVLAVEIAQMSDDLEGTKKQVEENMKFLADLEADCKVKQQEHEERVRIRGEELKALTETVKILSDDDALELFKKTLPPPAASFLQVVGSERALRNHALAIVSQARARSSNPGLDFIALAIQGKGNGFAKVISMIVNMDKMLTNDQLADDKKKVECLKQIAAAGDVKAQLERSAGDLQTVIDEVQMLLDGVSAEITALKRDIRDLDKSVADATAVRKEEHMDYTDLMASDSAAKELINFAKNRMNQFYNPQLYKAAKKEELSKQQRIYENHGHKFVQVPAERREDSSGVIAMFDLLIADLDKEMQEAKTNEANGQEIFEKMIKDSQEKRASDLLSLGEKESSKAALEGNLQNHGDGHASLVKELFANTEHLRALHSDCDWLVENYETRKSARATEKDALANAKAVLSGADYA